MGSAMLAELIASWSLFQTSYLVGWCAAAALAWVGIWVVARNQIFLGAAVSQASALGIASALGLASLSAFATHADEMSGGAATALAVLAAVATALFTARGSRPGRETPEAVTGWVFLLGASVPVLLVAHSPHGLHEVERTLFSSVLGASRTDLALLAVVTVLLLLAVLFFRKRILLLSMDPEFAAAVGMREALWRNAAGVVLGVVVGLSMRATGMLYTFGCLVLPALIAKNLGREFAPVFWKAPAIALTAAVAGFVLAHHFDTPPAQTTVALLCALLALVWSGRLLRVRSARATSMLSS